MVPYCFFVLNIYFPGQNPTQGTLFKASQFLSEELPIRLAHRVKELEELPHNLSDMPSIIRVKNWYAQSFQVGRHKLRNLLYQVWCSIFCISSADPNHMSTPGPGRVPKQRDDSTAQGHGQDFEQAVRHAGAS